MNNNKMALGLLSAVLITGFVYKQIPESNQVQQDSNSQLSEEVDKETSVTTTGNESRENGVTDSALLTTLQPIDGKNNTAISSANSAISSQNKASVVAQSHQKPADHRSASQPKAHGHENQHRHPEDNSLIPPGEPKKPLPNAQGKG